MSAKRDGPIAIGVNGNDLTIRRRVKFHGGLFPRYIAGMIGLGGGNVFEGANVGELILLLGIAGENYREQRRTYHGSKNDPRHVSVLSSVENAFCSYLADDKVVHNRASTVSSRE